MYAYTYTQVYKHLCHTNIYIYEVRIGEWEREKERQIDR